MAHIIYARKGGVGQLVINGVDVSMDVFSDVELVEVGTDPKFAEVGLRVTFAVGRLDLNQESDVIVTDRFPAVAQMVRSISHAVRHSA